MRDPPPAPDRRADVARRRAPTRDARLWRLGAGGALLVVRAGLDARVHRALPARRARRLRRRRGGGARRAADRRRARAHRRRAGARTARACGSRRCAASPRATTALLAAVGALPPAPGAVLYPLLARRGHLDHELERPGLHRRRRDLGPRPRGHGDEPAEHADLGRRRARAHRLRRARRGDLVDAPPTPCSRSRRWRPSPCLRPLEGEEDDRIAARARSARARLPEPLPVEAT